MTTRPEHPDPLFIAVICLIGSALALILCIINLVLATDFLQLIIFSIFTFLSAVVLVCGGFLIAKRHYLQHLRKIYQINSELSSRLERKGMPRIDILALTGLMKDQASTEMVLDQIFSGTWDADSIRVRIERTPKSVLNTPLAFDGVGNTEVETFRPHRLVRCGRNKLV